MQIVYPTLNMNTTCATDLVIALRNLLRVPVESWPFPVGGWIPGGTACDRLGEGNLSSSSSLPPTVRLLRGLSLPCSVPLPKRSAQPEVRRMEQR